MQVIIFPNENGGVSIISVAPEYEDQMEAVAYKDVPFQREWVSTGSQVDEATGELIDGGYFRETVQVWRIVDASELPPREFRDKWRWTDEGPLTVSD